jgi:putative ABC transport system permease protein
MRFILRLFNLFRPHRAEPDLAREIAAHLALLEDDFQRRGLSPEDAPLAARRVFGGVEQTKDRHRDARSFAWLDDARRDLLYAARTLRRSPGFAATAILTLALGIGANTAIFSLINTLILRQLPVRHPEQLVEFLSLYPGDPPVNSFTPEYYAHVRDQSHVFSDLIGMAPARFQISGEGRDAETMEGAFVTGTLFTALGVQPAIGRLISVQDDRLDNPDAAVAVVSWSYWKNTRNLDRAILGTRIVVDGVSATIVGVTRPEFVGLELGSTPDIWVPAALEPAIRRQNQRTSAQSGLKLMARLKAGVSIEQAHAEMAVLDQWRIDEVLKTRADPLWRTVKLDVEPAGAGFSTLRGFYAKPLLALMAIVGLLLLIACTNIASLLLARGAARQREMAVRVSLGAGRLRLVRQVLTESLLLSVTGSVLGAVFAFLGADALVRMMTSGRRIIGLPQNIEIRVQPDLRVLIFAVSAAVLTGILFGLPPAWSAFSTAPASPLRQSGGGGDTRSRRLFGKGLVVAQVALSLVLLSAAALFMNHLSNLRNLDLGFQRDGVLLVTLDPRDSGYNRTQLADRYRELLGRLEAIPGVRSAVLSGMTPISGAAGGRFVTVEGFEEPPEARRYLRLNTIAPKFFDTYGTPLIAGRDFGFQDAGGPRVAIVNEAMVRYYFGARDPLGKHVTFVGEDRPYEIIGVVGDAKYSTLHEPAPRMMYMDAFQGGSVPSEFSLRTDVAPTAVAGDVRRVVREVTKNVRVSHVTTLADQVDASIVPERLIATLSGFFGALGALLAAIGLYGLLAYTVARRTNEIGIRMALGATAGDVIGGVVKTSLALAALGLIVGAPLAILGRRVAMNLIEGLPEGSPMPLALAAAAMIAIALLAAYVPARRASRVDPMIALRCE